MAMDSKINTFALKKRLPYVMAAVFAAAAVMLIRIYLHGEEEKIKAKEKNVPRAQVVVAAEDIPAGAVLTDNMVALEEKSVDALQPYAADNPARVVGRIVVGQIAKGEQILTNKLALPGKETTLATKTPFGKRAVTVSVDNIAALSGMIKPGNHVDVLGIVPMPSGQAGPQLINLPLFQDVLILAVGTQLDTQAQAADRYAKKETRESSPLITLALTPQEANLISFVQEQGKVRLALRSPMDTDTQKLPPATLESLLQYAYPEMLMQQPVAATVEVYRGLKKEEMPLASSKENR